MAGDTDGVMEDYTEDSVFISNLGGVMKGLDAIRGVFAAAPRAAFPASRKVSSTSTATSPSSPGQAEGIALGTDTFVVRDGKIVAQTVVLHFA